MQSCFKSYCEYILPILSDVPHGSVLGLNFKFIFKRYWDFINNQLINCILIMTAAEEIEPSKIGKQHSIF